MARLRKKTRELLQMSKERGQLLTRGTPKWKIARKQVAENIRKTQSERGHPQTRTIQKRRIRAINNTRKLEKSPALAQAMNPDLRRRLSARATRKRKSSL